MSFKIRVEGDEEIIKKLTNTAIVQGELEDAGVKSGAAVQKRAATYPRQVPGSSYKRTGTLGRNWGFTVKPFATGVRSFLENPVEYAHAVQGTIDQQIDVHKGRWPTTTQMLKEQTQKIVGFFTTARDRIVRQLGN